MKPGFFLAVLLALAPLGAPAADKVADKGADKEKVTWLLSQNGGKSWCAYADGEEFKRAVAVQQPEESARVTTFAGDVLELEYQINPPTGEWVVMDKYAYTGGKLILQRTNLLLLQGLEAVQEATITGSVAAPFRVVSLTTLDGAKTARADVTYPKVPVRTSWKAFAFLDVARKIEAAAVPELCGKVN